MVYAVYSSYGPCLLAGRRPPAGYYIDRSIRLSSALYAGVQDGYETGAEVRGRRSTVVLHQLPILSPNSSSLASIAGWNLPCRVENKQEGEAS
jgi:hypothetical protein